MVLEHILWGVQTSDDFSHVWYFEDLAWVFDLITKTVIIQRIEIIRLRSSTIKGNIVGVQKHAMSTWITLSFVTLLSFSVLEYYCDPFLQLWLKFWRKGTEICQLKSGNKDKAMLQLSLWYDCLGSLCIYSYRFMWLNFIVVYRTC
jgi:hypothetical protein